MKWFKKLASFIVPACLAFGIYYFFSNNPLKTPLTAVEIFLSGGFVGYISGNYLMKKSQS